MNNFISIKNLYIISGTLIILLSSCEKRFWYRKKVHVESYSFSQVKRKTVKVEVMNYSPEYISKSFERTIQKVGEYELFKQGFIQSGKDTPNFTMLIFLSVDSYYVYGFRTGGKIGTNYHSVVSHHRLPGTGDQTLKVTNIVKELSFTYRLISPKSGNLYWESDDGLYYLNNEQRDLRRSIGMVKYALSNVQ